MCRWLCRYGCGLSSSWRQACWRRAYLRLFTCGGLLGWLTCGGLTCGSSTPQQHRNWQGAARRLATAAVALLYRSAGGSTSGLVCFGTVGARRVFSAFVFLARGGVGLSGCGVEPSCVGQTAAAGQPLPSSLVAEPPKIPPPCLPTLRRPAPSSCHSASLQALATCRHRQPLRRAVPISVLRGCGAAASKPAASKPAK